jgi:hypothetical protein
MTANIYLFIFKNKKTCIVYTNTIINKLSKSNNDNYPSKVSQKR